MLDFDATKLIIIGIAALIFIGPKDLPRVLRQVGGFVAKMRRMASEFQGQFMDAMKESEMDELKKDMQKIAQQAKADISFDPRDTERELREALEKKPEGPQPAIQAPIDPDSPAFHVDIPPPPETPDVAKSVATAEGTDQVADKAAVEVQPQKVAQGS
ncbi:MULTISPECIES: Sec-independent protein translocase protein TatB [unclassified Beijerinckia]|uniref:Sec-independent protein translocase protein TatB n=1 Tax=unclassified Beijerinckia TaxID=2638183 RepID=UPI0008965036|nr:MULTISPECIES: Sec-independent protein translocase protein TatB [unclassified Beijerinckia]MDH7795644.1 sec-independent protein translocase protein TatB [Beijerinckia sp. GAS462]SEC10008.1 sec-independent protein translocase protein TatB [Beijerinckia sp. 28-YEA-48]